MKISRNAKIIYGIVAVLFVVMFLLYQVSLNIWGVYTVSKITRVITIKGGTKVSYQFNVNGKDYRGNVSEPMRSENVGKHYFVKFLKISPSINLLLPEHPAENCLVYKHQVKTELPQCK